MNNYKKLKSKNHNYYNYIKKMLNKFKNSFIKINNLLK